MQFEASGLKRVKTLREAAQDPLHVVIETAQANSPYKDFYFGTKLVIDIRDAPKKTKAKTGKSKADIKPVIPSQTELEPYVKAEFEPQKEPKQEPKPEPKVEDKPQGKTATAESTSQALAFFTPEAKPIKINADKTPVQKPNVITVSSVSPTSLAVFEYHDKLWVVSGDPNILLDPLMQGVQAADMAPIEEKITQAARLYTVNALEGADYYVQGGGLVWRVLIGRELSNAEPVIPVRENGTLVWPMARPAKIAKIKDPVGGQDIHVITSWQAEDIRGQAMNFIEFSVLPSPLGLAIIPRVDDLEITIEPGRPDIRITRPGGLQLARQDDIKLAKNMQQRTMKKEGAYEDGGVRLNSLLAFQDWKAVSIKEFGSVKSAVLGALPGLTSTGRGQSLLGLAQTTLANGMGPETLGFLQLAQDILPDLPKSPEYRALKGVALTLTGRYEQAVNLLAAPPLNEQPEIKYWLSYTLAKLQDWRQAEKNLPLEFYDLEQYPAQIAAPLAVTLTEVALRAGDFLRANELIAIAMGIDDQLRPGQKAALQYLEGEKARQQGEFDKTIELWSDLAKGSDDLFKVRAALALTRIEREKDKITLSDAVDRLERLRYSWRGDDLEAQVNYWLGKIYFDHKQYVKGLNIMRDASSYANGPFLGARLVEEMQQKFQDLYLTDRLDDVPAPEAAALYERFSELVPSNATGDQMTNRLANHLAKAGLYARAAALLNSQIKTRLEGEDAFDAVRRLSVIHLLDDNPNDARGSCDGVSLQKSKLANNAAIDEELSLLRARALGLQEKDAEALEVLIALEATPPVNRLRADLAWRFGYWDEAADALNGVLQDDGIAAGGTLNEEQAALLLRRAVALNLAGDRIRLASLRTSFTPAMSKTGKARIFEVVTRPRRPGELADRETLLSVVSEVEVFKDFLDAYEAEIAGE